jgi:exoribonuclease R
VPWSDDATEYTAILAGLDPADPAHAALITESARLFRGAAYEPFDGSPPADPAHHAIGGPYAHVTAPLRRLVDRYTNEIVLAVSAGRSLPSWVEAGFADLPATMDRARQHQGRLDRASVDFMEAMVLRGREGDRFEAVVTAVDDDGEATVQLTEPAVIARVADLEADAGTRVTLRLDAVDDEAGSVRFRPV